MKPKRLLGIVLAVIIAVITAHLPAIAQLVTFPTSQGPTTGMVVAQSPAPVAPVPGTPQATPSSLPPTVDPASLAPQIPAEQTALLFQNKRYAVRIFQEGEQYYINAYDKEKQVQPLDKVPVSITPANTLDGEQTKYIATVGENQYVVTINQLGNAILEILSRGNVTYRDPASQVTIAQQIPGITATRQSTNPNQEFIRKIFVSFAQLTLFTLMLSIGLGWTFEHVVWLWKRPWLLLRSLFSVIIAVTILGFLIVPNAGLTVAERIGVGVLLICPGAPLIPFKTSRAGGNTMFAGSLQITVCVLAIVSIPLILFIAGLFFPNKAWITPLEIAKQIFFAQVLPLGIGVVIRQYWSQLADEILRPVSQIAKVLLLVGAVVLLTVSLDRILHMGFISYLMMALLALATLACGHFLGGPDPTIQTALAYATVTRNAGLAFLLVSLNFKDLGFVKGGIIDSLIAYALIAAIVSIPYTVWRKRRHAQPSLEEETMQPT